MFSFMFQIWHFLPPSILPLEFHGETLVGTLFSVNFSFSLLAVETAGICILLQIHFIKFPIKIADLICLGSSSNLLIS
jgi:hypothetical protein